MKVLIAALLLASTAARADILPGFRIERVASAEGFLTSLVADSRETLYYTALDGTVYRLRGTESEVVARVTTDPEGNSGLLGMALIDDTTAVVHYTTPRQTYDMVSRINLQTGVESTLHAFVCDILVPERGSLSEHHGGNPIVAPDGSVFVGLGDQNWGDIAADPKWNAGKIFKIAPDGTATQFARGVRNPFDLAWDATRGRLIVGDNGPVGGDEIHIIDAGANCGWPYSWGLNQTTADSVTPDYVFAATVAPTGMLLVNNASPVFQRGLLVGTFVTKSLVYFTNPQGTPLADPVTLFSDEVGPVIDVTQTVTGQIYFATGFAIYRLLPPARGDCNGDGVVGRSDYDALLLELADGEEPMTSAQDGRHRGSWGCDANHDGLISALDKDELVRMLSWRRRLVQRR